MKKLELIDRRIKKLQQLRDLLADPELAEFTEEMFASKPVPTAESQLSLPRAKRRYERRGGSLITKTEKSLREFGGSTTATELAGFMQKDGFKFKAKNPNIAVSKALRQLAAMGRINSRRGDSPKAPITYWVPATLVLQSLAKVPVQEETTH